MYEQPHVQLAAERLAAMGIVLPAPRNDAAMDVLRYHHANIYVSWHDICNDAPPIEEEIGAILTQFSCPTVLALLSLISRLLHEREHPSSRLAVQSGLAKWMLPEPFATAAQWRMTAPGKLRRDSVFHQEQLLAASALALRHAGDGALGPLSQEERHRLGVLLLQINSHLPAPPGLPPDSDEMLGHTVRTLRFGESEAQPDLAARYFELFAERTPAAHGRGTLSYDVAADLIAEHGVDPVTFMGLGALLMVPWVGGSPASFAELGGAITRQVDGLGLSSAADALLAADRSWFQEQLRISPLRTADYLPLYERPFLRGADGGLIPMNWRLIMERAYAGLYWVLHEMYRRRDGAKGVQDWIGRLGRGVYEPYVHDRLRSVYPRRDPGAAVYLTEEDVGTYRRQGQDVAGADGYLREGRVLVVLEVTASALPARAVMSGDGGQVVAALERLLLDRKGKFTQLDRVIADLLSGVLTLPGVETNGIELVIPLVVTASPLPQFPTVRYRLRDRWTARRLFVFGDRVMAPQLMNLQEREWLEAALEGGEVTLTGLLRDRAREYDGGSIKNYLLTTGRGELLRRSASSEAAWERYRAAVRAQLAALGVPE